MPFISFWKLVAGFAITIAVVLLVLLYTFSTQLSQRKALGNIQIAREELQKLEPALINMEEFEHSLNSFVYSNGQQQSNFFAVGSGKLEDDSIRLTEIANSDSSKQHADDYRRLVNLLHQVKDYASFIIHVQKTKSNIVARAELEKGNLTTSISDFKTGVENLENSNRQILSNSYGKSVSMARKAFIFTGIISGLLILILFISFLVSFKDIRNRFSYNQELEKFRNALNNSADAVYIIDREKMRYIDLNESACSSTGYTRSELLSMGPQHLRQLQTEESLAKEYDEIIHSAARKRIFATKYFRKDGSSFDAEISIQAIKEGNKDILITVARDITERKKTEEQLKKFNEELEQQVKSKTAEINKVFERVTDAFIALDKEWRYTYLNEKAGIMHGRKPEDLIGKNIWTEFPDVIREPFYDALHGAMEKQKPLRLQLYYSTTDRWFEDLIYPSPDGVSVYYHDITERKMAEEALINNELRFRTLTVNAPVGIFQTDAGGKTTYVNETWLHYTGMKFNEALGDGWLEAVHPDDRESLIKGWYDKSEKGLESSSEYRLVDKSGNTRWVSGRAVPIFNKANEITGYIGTLSDITESKNTEQLIRNSEETKRLIMDSALDAIISMDSSGRITVWTPQAEKTFGWKQKEIIGKTIVDTIIPSQYREQHKRGFAHYLKTGEGPVLNKIIEITALNKEGKEFPIELSIIPIKQDQSEFFCAFIRDITERKKAEEKLKENEAQLIVATQIAKLGYWEFNIADNVFTFNDQFYSIFKTTVDKVGGYTMSPDHYIGLFVHPDDMNTVGTEIEKAITATDADLMRQVEHRIIYADGKTGYVSVHFYIVKDDEGHTIKTFGVNQDITERKLAEEEIKRSEEKYRLLVDQAADAIFIFEQNGSFTDVNNISEKLLGYTRAEILKMSLPDILFKEDLAAKPIQFEQLVKGKSVINRRRFKRKDGKAVEVEVHSNKLPDGRYLGMVRNLSERLKAEEEIRKAKELTDKMIDSLPGVFYLFDKTGKYIRWNRLKEKITEYTAEEMKQRHPVDFFEGTEKDLIRTCIEEAFITGKTEVEAHLVSKSGKKYPYYFTGLSIEYEGKPCLLGMGIDISEQKKTQDELEQSYKAIRELSEHLQHIREEERIHIAREIHDELGQQLTVMKMDISWLNRKINKTADDDTKQKMRDLLLMLDGTVKTVRRISSELRPSLLDDLGLIAAIEWQLEEFEKRSGIKTRFIGPGEEIELMTEVKTSLFRIFQESLTNVARHADATKVTVSLTYEHKNLILNITDNGKGFDKHKIADKRTLGLLGMKERTAMIGGTYDIISTPGKGTAVVVIVPLQNNNSEKSF